MPFLLEAVSRVRITGKYDGLIPAVGSRYGVENMVVEASMLGALGLFLEFGENMAQTLPFWKTDTYRV